MAWKTIISFTDKNKPFRFKVATSKNQSPAVKGKWYNVSTQELDEFDNPIDLFDFRLNVDDGLFEPTDSEKPLLLISEQMIEEVRKGHEEWG